MKPGTKVALKEKHPQIDHRCKGFVTRYDPQGTREDQRRYGDLCFWCLKCEKEIHWVGKHLVIRVVPKALAWINIYKLKELSSYDLRHKMMASAIAAAENVYSDKIAPVYLGRKRKVK